MSDFSLLSLKPTIYRQSGHQQVEHSLAIPFLPAHLQARFLYGERTLVFLWQGKSAIRMKLFRQGLEKFLHALPVFSSCASRKTSISILPNAQKRIDSNLTMARRASMAKPIIK